MDSNEPNDSDVAWDFKKVVDYCVKTEWLVIVLLIILFPIGAYCMWKGDHFTKNARIIISVILVLWSMYLIERSSAQSGGYSSSNCPRVDESGGCRYYYDYDCKFVARECD